jgi:hypothetical protein
MVRILCEGKTDKKFILNLLSHIEIEDKAGDFEIMGCKNNFFEIQKYKMITQLVDSDQLKKLLFVLDADYQENDSRYGGYNLCHKEINNMIDNLGLSRISDVIIIRDYKTNSGYLESLTGSEARVCLDGNLSVRDNEGHSPSEMLPFQGNLSLNLSEHKIKDADLKVDDHYCYNGTSQSATR